MSFKGLRSVPPEKSGWYSAADRRGCQSWKEQMAKA